MLAYNIIVTSDNPIGRCMIYLVIVLKVNICPHRVIANRELLFCMSLAHESLTVLASFCFSPGWAGVILDVRFNIDKVLKRSILMAANTDLSHKDAHNQQNTHDICCLADFCDASFGVV